MSLQASQGSYGCFHCTSKQQWQVSVRDVCRLVTNICNMACSDPAETPSASLPDPPLEAASGEEAGLEPAADAAASDPVLEAAANARKVSWQLPSLHVLCTCWAYVCLLPA